MTMSDEKGCLADINVVSIEFSPLSTVELPTKNFQGKIGMNTQANKFCHVSNMIGLDLLNLGFVHYKKVVKVQFLKFGKT